jgi:hypothetical protein
MWYGGVHKALSARLSIGPKVMAVVVQKTHATSSEKHENVRAFNAQAFLASSGIARTIVQYRKQEPIHSQGDLASTVVYIQQGGVKLSVVNELGR